MRRFLGIVVLALATTGCGLKGPLYLPGQSPKNPVWPAPAQAPQPAPEETPRAPDTPATSDHSK
jgi:predicted small lipoprotein YifL